MTKAVCSPHGLKKPNTQDWNHSMKACVHYAPWHLPDVVTSCEYEGSVRLSRATSFGKNCCLSSANSATPATKSGDRDVFRLFSSTPIAGTFSRATSGLSPAARSMTSLRRRIRRSPHSSIWLETRRRWPTSCSPPWRGKRRVFFRPLSMTCRTKSNGSSPRSKG